MLEEKRDSTDALLAKIDAHAARLERKIVEAGIATTRLSVGAIFVTAGLVWAIVKYSN